MTFEEYEAKKKEILEEADRRIAEIGVEFALSNNPVSIGDVITDHYQAIKVDKIHVVGRLTFLPSCVYSGTLISKTGKPFKNGKKSCVHQSNLRTINGKVL